MIFSIDTVLLNIVWFHYSVLQKTYHFKLDPFTSISLTCTLSCYRPRSQQVTLIST